MECSSLCTKFTWLGLRNCLARVTLGEPLNKKCKNLQHFECICNDSYLIFIHRAEAYRENPKRVMIEPKCLLIKT